jgi:glycosyltransferase involved in cell wall biosynthesis
MLNIGLPSTKENAGPKIFLRRLKRTVKKNKMAKTCHFLNPFHDIGLYNSIARNFYNKPYIVRIDGIYFDNMEIAGNNEEKNKPIFEAIKKANGIIFQSEFDKKLIKSFYGDINKQNTIINNGVEKNLKNVSYREELNFPDKKIVLCSSNWRKHKRLDAIVEVIKKINNIENKYHLIVVGDNSDAFVEKSDNNITLVGHIEPENLYKYYKSSDLYIHIPWIDHCPNTLVEAIGNGVPVVTSNQGGARELVEKTNAGIISQCDDDIAIGEYIDLYNPPKPDVETIADDILKIFGNYLHYKNNINCEPVNIDNVARQYINFIEKVFLEYKGNK